ncbi:hypothetical protein UlMin_036423 [Ulmus minor]
MDQLKNPARLMIVSDIDYTMVDHHDAEDLSLLRFNALWESNYHHDSLLLRKEKPMLTLYITIISVGTEITYGNSMVLDEGWVEYLNQKWDKNIVIEEACKFYELTLQVKTEIRPQKVSFYVQKDKAQAVTKALSKSIAKCGLDVKIIYSGGMDLDILPQGVGKGQALGKFPVSTLVCGDSGNNAELFSIPYVHGVMVSNAQEELLHWYAKNAKNNPKIIQAIGSCAAGIIQFLFGPNFVFPILPLLRDSWQHATTISDQGSPSRPTVWVQRDDPFQGPTPSSTPTAQAARILREFLRRMCLFLGIIFVVSILGLKKIVKIKLMKLASTWLS